MGRGNFYTTAECKNYSEHVRLLVFKSGQPRFGETDRLSAEIILRPQDKRPFDLDNRLKRIFDSLEDAKVFPNDNQIDQLYIERGSIKKPAEVLVVIRRLV